MAATSLMKPPTASGADSSATFWKNSDWEDWEDGEKLGGMTAPNFGGVPHITCHPAACASSILS